MSQHIALFVLAATAIGLAGVRMSRVADRLADRTGMGETLAGVVLLAAATSIPDFAATLSAALDQRPRLAMSNIIGSMAANLAFLGIADIAYRKANLEHASASAANLTQAALFITLLTLPLIAAMTPAIEFAAMHPVSAIIVIVYVLGMRLVRTAQTEPMWRPRQTPHTVTDQPEPGAGRESVARLWLAFAGLTAVMAVAGWLIMDSAEAIVDSTGIDEAVAGGVFTAISTSLPELVTTIAAVRYGALALAVGNILGTNFFNVVVIAAADVAYRSGSIYHALPETQIVFGLIVILMTAVLLLGMVQRQTFGIWKIGFESALILLLYAGAVAMLIVG